MQFDQKRLYLHTISDLLCPPSLRWALIFFYSATVSVLFESFLEASFFWAFFACCIKRIAMLTWRLG